MILFFNGVDSLSNDLSWLLILLKRSVSDGDGVGWCQVSSNGVSWREKSQPSFVKLCVPCVKRLVRKTRSARRVRFLNVFVCFGLIL